MNNLRKENGIALILALIILLIISILAISASFTSNLDFQMMSNYKQGQEAFLAAERCIDEARKQFEVVGIETLFFQLQSGINAGIQLTLPNGAQCRTGPRDYDSSSGPIPFLQVPPPTKLLGRPLKHTSLPSGGVGGAAVVPVSFIVTGKDARDKDKNDSNPNINTGTEISAGFESIIPGGASNVY
jgi:type IV pilus assembly PilX-like protein